MADFTLLGRVLTGRQCRELVALGSAIGWRRGTTLGGKKDIRKSEVAFLSRDDYPSHWIFSTLNALVPPIAALMDIDCTPEKIESVQLSRYPAGGYYDFHTDHAPGHQEKYGGMDRKLSLVIALDSSPNAGIELSDIGHIRLNAGDAIAFSSLSSHRAPTQEDGARHSLAVWVPGPTWR